MPSDWNAGGCGHGSPNRARSLRLDGDGSAPARLKLIGDELRRRLTVAEPPDKLIRAVAARLRASNPRPVHAISAELGVSERQLRRRFHTTVGYGPKTFARILRFQQMLELVRLQRKREAARGRDSFSLGQLAIDAGYADQAHMTEERTRLAGASPARLLAVRYPLRPNGRVEVAVYIQPWVPLRL